MLDDIPEKWGAKFGLGGRAAAGPHKGPNAIRFIAPAPMALVVFNSDHATSGTSSAGSLEIIPAQAELYAQRSVEKQNLLLAVDARRLEQLAGVVFDKETFELHPLGPGQGDSRAHQLAHWIRYEIENNGLSWNECVDALITVFAAHLHSSPHNRSVRPYVGGLRQSSGDAWMTSYRATCRGP